MEGKKGMSEEMLKKEMLENEIGKGGEKLEREKEREKLEAKIRKN